MKRSIAGLFASMLVLTSAASAAEEPKVCEGRAAILALAETVLAERSQLPRFPARRFGAEAAYLKMRYTPMSLEDAAVLAHALREASVREAADLAGAIDATRGGMDALPAESAGQPGFASGPSTLRAIVLKGETEKLVAAMAALPENSSLRSGQPLITAIVDRPDTEKAAVAEIAARHGLIYMQAGLVATQSTPDAWTAFARDLDPAKAADLARSWSWAPALFDRPALPRPAADAAQEAARKQIHAVMIAAMHTPERDFLATFINQTGDLAAGSKAAAALMAAIAAGNIRPEGELDRPWLLVYRSLRAGFEPGRLDATLDGVTLSARRHPQMLGTTTVRDMIDWLIATDALTAYVKGETADPPEMPVDLGAKFRDVWPLWLDMAKAVRSAPLADFASDRARGPIVAELLHAAGDGARLSDFIGSIKDPEVKVALANDFAGRLDRGCQSVLYHKGDALLLAGLPIFKFGGWK
jgi:hypothetical protein